MFVGSMVCEILRSSNDLQPPGSGRPVSSKALGYFQSSERAFWHLGVSFTLSVCKWTHNVILSIAKFDR
jgi:hypothetical protein